MDFIEIQNTIVARNQIVYVKKWDSDNKPALMLYLLVKENIDGIQPSDDLVYFYFDSEELRDKEYRKISRQLVNK